MTAEWVPVGNHDNGHYHNYRRRSCRRCGCHGGGPFRLSDLCRRIVGVNGSTRKIVIFVLVPLILITGLAAGLNQRSSRPRSLPSSVIAPSPTCQIVDSSGAPTASDVTESFPTAAPEDLPGSPIGDSTVPSVTVIAPRAALSRNEFVSSANGAYTVGLTRDGRLVLRMIKGGSIVWQTPESGAEQCSMQPDGNLVCRRDDDSVSWQSCTSKHTGAEFQLDDGGQISVVLHNTPLWLAGMPRGNYISRSNESIDFPIRGAFYYPWYPETWTVNGSAVHYTPKLGMYNTGDPQVHISHVEALDYAHVDVAIASWWGPDQQSDRARITSLLSTSRGAGVKWSVYHEAEHRHDQTVDQLRDDLDYLKKWFAWHESWAHVNGKPLVFVFNEADCDVVERWTEAGNDEWHIVLKTFIGQEDCVSQVDGWHEYAPVRAAVQKLGCSYAISPGFWRADQTGSRLTRRTKLQWYLQVRAMVDSNEPWQLVTTFNQWGESSAVESALEWSSSSGFGYYLDALHEIY